MIAHLIYGQLHEFVARHKVAPNALMLGPDEIKALKAYIVEHLPELTDHPLGDGDTFAGMTIKTAAPGVMVALTL